VTVDGHNDEVPFLSFFVGCNKAIDAINSLRLGSRNPEKFSVDQWKRVLSNGTSAKFAGSSCAQFERESTTTGLHIKEGQNSSNAPHRQAQVYCFEPLSTTFAQLARAKLEIGYTNELVLEEAAVSYQPGTIKVPRDIPLGTENQGIDVMKCEETSSDENKCRQIPIYTLNDYVGSLPHKPQIHFLSVDVEGYDFEVLKGADQILSKQVHYLEFEYNRKGAWRRQPLKDALEYLETQNFQCYWPGRNGHIWRITGCWMDYYSNRFWSNVACVNGNIPEAQPLADAMEAKFLETIEIRGLVYQRGNT